MLLGHFKRLQKHLERQLKQVLVIRRNVSNESEFRISGGRLFQARAAAPVHTVI